MTFHYFHLMRYSKVQRYDIYRTQQSSQTLNILLLAIKYKNCTFAKLKQKELYEGKNICLQHAT